MNPCVVNFGKGAWYPRGRQRLLDSLKGVGYAGGILSYTDESQIGAPTHQQAPYAFKTSCFLRAQEAGHDVVLWCDCSVWAIRPLDALLEHVRREGHVFFQGGWNCAQWSTDSSLESLGVTRDEAEKLPMLMACCMGLDLTNPRSAEFLRRWHEKAMDGHTFAGPWSNEGQACSKDPRCLGHRHDQTAASVIGGLLGMEQIVGHESHFAYYYGKMEEIKDSVCLLAQGM